MKWLIPLLMTKILVDQCIRYGEGLIGTLRMCDPSRYSLESDSNRLSQILPDINRGKISKNEK